MVASAPLSVDELAYLAGGAAGLGASALVALRENGEVTALGPRQLVAVGSVTRAQRQPGAARAARADGPDRHRRSPSHRLARRAHERGGAGAAALGKRGLIATFGLRSRLRSLSLLFIALLAVGILRFVDGVRNGKPVTFLVVLIVLTFVVWRFSLRVPNVTPRRARRRCAQARVESEALRTGSLPGDRALAVALFGIGALWLAEPALRASSGFARASARRAAATTRTGPTRRPRAAAALHPAAARPAAAAPPAAPRAAGGGCGG